MDLLKKELERKKQTLKSGISTEKRYRKASELRQWEEEHPAIVNASNTVADFKRHRLDEHEHMPAEKRHKLDESLELKNQAAINQGQIVAQLSPEDVTRQFRLLGLPVRLFGEDQTNRIDRLKKSLAEHKETLVSLSEMEEFRLGKGHGIRNPFLQKEKEDKPSGEHTATETKPQHHQEPKQDDEDGLESTDPHKRIYRYFKGLLQEWEDDLAKRPEQVKKTAAGKNETKTYQQCKDYIRPLFKLCKHRNLEESIMKSILKIIDFCQDGEFVKAHDVYLDVAIGRAPWPIGVTQVGIHSRTGRSKIESQNVAHVMNSELQRKYLTSVKRLMTFAQNKRADVLHSKKVLN